MGEFFTGEYKIIRDFDHSITFSLYSLRLLYIGNIFAVLQCP